MMGAASHDYKCIARANNVIIRLSARKRDLSQLCISTSLLSTPWASCPRSYATRSGTLKKDQTVFGLVAITNWRLPQCVENSGKIAD
jgi:hypothetical protein